MGNYDLIICDIEFEIAAGTLSAYMNRLYSALSQYHSIVDSVKSSGVSSGEVHDALCEFSEQISKVLGVCEGLGGMAESVISNFLSDFDDADSYIYKSGISPVRDFSLQEQEYMMAVLDDPLTYFTDEALDTILGLVKSIIDIVDRFIDVDSLKRKIQTWKRAVFDYNDTTRHELNAIINAVYSVDRKYGVVESGPGATGAAYVGTFADFLYLLMDIQKYVEKMAAIVGPGKGQFTVQVIHETFGDLADSINEEYDHLKDIAVSTEPTVESISDFVVDDTCFEIFNNSYIISFFAALGFAEGYEMSLFNWYKQMTDSVVHGSDYQIKLELQSILESEFSKGSYFDKAKTEEREDVKKAIKAFLDGGEEELDKYYKSRNTQRDENKKLLLDGRTTEAKRIKGAMEALGDISKFVEMGDDGLELLARLFYDYDEGLEIIESYERNCQYGEAAKVLREIKADYNKEFSAITSQICETAGEYGLDAAVGALKDYVPIIKKIFGVQAVIDEVGDYTGLKEKGDGIYDACWSAQVSEGTEKAYQNAVIKLRNCTAPHDSDEYKMLTNDVKNCFNMNKNALADTYSAMAKAETGTKKSYYQFYADRLRNMSIQDADNSKFITYEEYLSRFA